MKLPAQQHYAVALFVNEIFGTNVRLEAGRNFALPCPFHRERTKKRHLYVSKVSGLWICFKCGEKGSFPWLVHQVAKDDPTLDPDRYLSGPALRHQPLSTPAPVLLPPLGDPPKGTVPLMEETRQPMVERVRLAGLAYLSRRGVSETVAAMHHARVGVLDRYAGRVLFPVCLPDTNVPLGWVARAFRPGITPKVLNTTSPEGRMSIDAAPFGLNIAQAKGHRSVVLVEGIFDALRHGTEFLALQGKRATKEQHAWLVKSRFDKITVMLDPDATPEARALAKSLRMHVPEVWVASLTGAKDPGEATPEQVRAALDSALRC